MPAVQYPFIDIAVHERVKDHFARGEAIVLFSLDLSEVLWANGAGARLFGKPVLYDLIEDGPNPNDVTFRQVEASGRQLKADGETRRFLIRIPTGFQRVAVQAVVERIRLTPRVDALLFAAPVDSAPQKIEKIAADMLTGFDDPDTHMAVLGDGGEILSASPSFNALGLSPATARRLVEMAGSHAERLVKRPIPTAKGYLPAAIGKVSDRPGLHLLFAVETILGNMGPSADFPEESAPSAVESPVVAVAEAAPLAESIPAVSEAEAPRNSETPEAMQPVDAASAEDEAEEVVAVAPSSEETALVEAASFEPQPGESAASAPETETETGLPLQQETVKDPAPAKEAPEAVAAEADAEAVPAAAVSEPVAPAPAEEAQALAPAESLPAAEAADDFRPNRSARPTRFVWKIDADGQFSEVSPELAAAVGPHAADLSGVAFTDIASLLDLDPDGKIAELLGRRDTWSGKTIYWPVEGTNLKAPVDLAALPTYRRNREFDGFRGFGIVRLSDAIEDPQAIGLTLGTQPAAPEKQEVQPESDAAFHLPEEEKAESAAEPAITEDQAPAPVADVPSEPHVEEEETAASAEEQLQAPEAASAETEAAAPETEPSAADPLPQPGENPTTEENRATAEARIEPPVFRAQPVLPSASEKIIKLAEHRLRGRDGLTPGEQEAFREIARQLEPFRREDPTEVSGEPPVDQPLMEASDTIPVSGSETGGASESPQQTESPAAEPIEAMAPEAAAPDTQDHVNEQLEILASSIPARTAAATGLSPEAVDEIPVALLIHTGERMLHANPEFLRLTGYGSIRELEALGGLDALLHHRDLEDMPDQSGGLSLVRADDALVPVTARLQSVRWQDANALMLALIPSGPRPVETAAAEAAEQDPDEARLAARVGELQVEVDELRSILETATDGVVIIGPEGEIRSMNRSASALFDYNEAETRGKPFVMLFAHESHRAVADYLAGMTGHGVASVLNDGREVIGREASGGFIPLFMTIGRLSASNGYCAVIRDITQWKRTEEDLKNAKCAAETANAHKSDFLARVSHEIRTPLNAIIGFSDMMSIEHFGPIGHPRYVEYANDIARSGRLVLDIVNDLLDISKIEAGEMDLEFTAVGLNDAISEAVALVQPQAQANRVIIRTAFSESVPDVVADLRSIKQIVLNILANGIRFTQPGGQIVVSTAYEPNGSVVLRIRDTGVGMTRAELEQAMKPFRQVTPGTRKRGDGTGLGLPLTKAMVDANRATFAIHSTPNEGTLVEITFPSPRVLAN